MKKLIGWRTYLTGVLFAMIMGAVAAEAQTTWNQNTACPGWNNPSSFSAGNAQNYYRGQGGRISSRNTSQCPNALTGRTGTTWSNTIWTGAQMNTLGAGCSNPSQYGSVTPNKDMRPFAIMNATDQAPGHPVNRDPNTGDALPLVPTHFNTSDNSGRIVNTNFTKSIRVGDICANGGESGAQALYYHIFPTTDNAMLFIYYAIVVESPSHGYQDNPWFIIRVTKQNANGQFTNIDGQNNQLSDTLAYYVGSTPDDREGGTVHIESDPNVNGWHKYGSGGSQGHMQNNYKDWTKVAINLQNYLYQPLRVEVIIMDCTANYHFAYAYVAGECREMTIKTSGCPAGLDSSVTTLSAPRGMLKYEWSVSEYGKSDPVTRLDPGGEDDYFTFRSCRMSDGTPASGPEDSVIFRNGVPDTVHYCDYDVKASDFRVNYRPSTNPAQRVAVRDSMGNRQTFRCRMTSALDPAKPFQTTLYLSVQNQKPSMSIREAYDCDGNVKVWNQSYVPGDPTLVQVANSTWNYYTNPACSGTPIYTATGSNIENTFADTATRYLLLRTVTDDPSCYSEAIYPIKPLGKPKPGMTISNKVLCDADQTTLTDTTRNVYYREWVFLGDQPGEFDTLRGEQGNSEANKMVRRSFDHSIEPIRLRVLNGLHYEDEDGETVWCEATAIDTVAVFVHPDLKVEGDTIVCQGGHTDATVRALGVDGCTYEWSTTNGSITGDLPAGNRLQVEPYADVSTYYVRVTSPQGCVAWDSIHAYYVKPALVKVPLTAVCPGDTVMLYGLNADHYRWSADPADGTLSGQETADTILVSPAATTVYTMTGYGSNGCEATPIEERVSVMPLPVPAVGVDPAYIDTENPTLTLTNLSEGGATAVWLFEDGSSAVGREVQHTFEGVDHDTATHVLLTTANEIGCTVEYPFSIPVKLYTAWYPTIFTPGSEDDNDRFRLYTINQYDYFHISIFDRRGALVFESNDPAFSWDGTYKEEACKQGVYVYICSYRKPETATIITRQGTVTLVR